MTDETPADLVPQIVEPDWWHAFGPMPDGGTHVHGPTTLNPGIARTWTSILKAAYIGSFDHVPTDAEVAPKSS